MKRTFLFKFLLLLCMFIVRVHCVQAEETVYTKWKKTAPTSLATGDVVVIVDLTNAVAMSNDKGTSKAPGAESVTLNDEQTRITDEEVKDIVQWKVTVTGNGYKFAKLGSETELLYGDAENGLRVGSGAANEFNMLNNFLHIVLNKTNYYADVKSSFMSSTWELLAENEGKIDDSIKKTKIAFFKKVETTAQDIDFKFLYKNYQCDVKGVDDKSWFALELEASFPGDIYNPTTFTSSDPSIASIVMDANAQETVSTNGCHPGTATITAYFPGMVVDGLLRVVKQMLQSLGCIGGDEVGTILDAPLHVGLVVYGPHIYLHTSTLGIFKPGKMLLHGSQTVIEPRSSQMLEFSG